MLTALSRGLSRAIALSGGANVVTVLAEKKQAEALNIPPAAAREEVESGEGSEDDEVQDDFEADRPRLSLPIDQEQDDSFQLPPQISALLEDDLTQKSVEMPRRALADQFLLRDTARVSDIFVTPDRKSGVISHGSQRRASSPGFSFMVGNESIIQNNRQGYDLCTLLCKIIIDNDHSDDTEDLRRLVFTGDGVSETDTPFESAGERSRNLEDSTFRFDIPLDIPVEETSDIEQLPGIQDEESKLDAPEIDVAQNDEPESEPELEAMLSSAADDTVPGAVSMKGPQAFRAAKRPAPGAKRKPKITKQSRYGIDVPSLPMGVVKGIASSFLRPSGRKKAKLNKDTVAALMQASDWFFEQVAEDLGAYSKHAGRKTIEEADVVTLMGRQRVLNAGTTPFSLAQKFLPRELLQELRMPPPNDEKKRIRRTRKIRYDVDEEDMNEDEDDEEEED